MSKLSETDGKFDIYSYVQMGKKGGGSVVSSRKNHSGTRHPIAPKPRFRDIHLLLLHICSLLDSSRSVMRSSETVRKRYRRRVPSIAPIAYRTPGSHSCWLVSEIPLFVFRSVFVSEHATTDGRGSNANEGITTRIGCTNATVYANVLASGLNSGFYPDVVGGTDPIVRAKWTDGVGGPTTTTAQIR